jgi:hypothetical protein
MVATAPTLADGQLHHITVSMQVLLRRAVGGGGRGGLQDAAAGPQILTKSSQNPQMHWQAGLSAEAGAVDFETLLREDPDHVIEYLANRGTQLLGTFITEVRDFSYMIRSYGF